MYENGCGCECGEKGCIYRGDMYDVCRARLGTPRGSACSQIKFILLGAAAAGVCILFVSCCFC